LIAHSATFVEVKTKEVNGQVELDYENTKVRHKYGSGEVQTISLRGAFGTIPRCWRRK
jgi:hypothetical protein